MEERLKQLTAWLDSLPPDEYVLVICLACIAVCGLYTVLKRQ